VVSSSSSNKKTAAAPIGAAAAFESNPSSIATVESLREKRGSAVLLHWRTLIRAYAVWVGTSDGMLEERVWFLKAILIGRPFAHASRLAINIGTNHYPILTQKLLSGTTRGEIFSLATNSHLFTGEHPRRSKFHTVFGVALASEVCQCGRAQTSNHSNQPAVNSLYYPTFSLCANSTRRPALADFACQCHTTCYCFSTTQILRNASGSPPWSCR